MGISLPFSHRAENWYERLIKGLHCSHMWKHSYFRSKRKYNKKSYMNRLRYKLVAIFGKCWTEIPNSGIYHNYYHNGHLTITFTSNAVVFQDLRPKIHILKQIVRGCTCQEQSRQAERDLFQLNVSWLGRHSNILAVAARDLMRVEADIFKFFWK